MSVCNCLFVSLSGHFTHHPRCALRRVPDVRHTTVPNAGIFSLFFAGFFVAINKFGVTNSSPFQACCSLSLKAVLLAFFRRVKKIQKNQDPAAKKSKKIQKNPKKSSQKNPKKSRVTPLGVGQCCEFGHILNNYVLNVFYDIVFFFMFFILF